MRTHEGMGLGAHRKAIQRDCERVRGFTLPRMLARLREALEEAGEGGKKEQKKRAPTCSAPMEEYPGKISKNRIHPYYSLPDGNVKCLLSVDI